MQMLIMSVALFGAVPTEDRLLNQKTEVTYRYLSEDSRKFVGLTLIRKKGIFQPRRQVFVQVALSLKPWRNKLFTYIWRGTYTIQETPKELLITCHFYRRFETGIRGNLVQTPYLKSKTILLHLKKSGRGMPSRGIKLYFTTDKLKKLHFWKEKEEITLY